MSSRVQTLLQAKEHCWARDHTLLDAMVGNRVVLASAELGKQAECLISLDFSAAFDDVSHDYLLCIYSVNKGLMMLL